jgi:uncharacterized repeat protein (TIGR03803 family)
MIAYKISRSLAALALIATMATRAPAQSFTVLRPFNPGAGSTGYAPQAALVQGPDNTLYGTASAGGAHVGGTVFKIQPDGTGFAVLRSFSSASDGADPIGGLTLSGNTLYGTTSSGSKNGLGAVFTINTDGSGFAVLHSFAGSPYDGANSYATLALSGNTLYGTTYSGGASNLGIIFSVNTDGSGFTNLYSFKGGLDCGNPYAGLVLSGGILYGTTTGLGPQITDYGSIFRINTNGSGFVVLKTFKGGDGANPYGALLVFGSALYGTTDSGTPGYGTIFRLSENGSGFTTLYSFSGGSDGNAPYGALVISGGELYGTTPNGGAYGYGTIFKVNAGGGGFANLRSFTGGSDGGNPYGGLIPSGANGNFYGTADAGGSLYGGTVFVFNPFAPSINTQPQPANETVLAGANVTFRASVSGSAPLFLQWSFNSVALTNATAASLTLTDVASTNSGTYALFVSNSFGSVWSSNVVLTVASAIASTLPASGLSANGATLNGSVSAVSATVAWFDWGTDTNYGSSVGMTNIAGNSETVSISAALSGLDAGLTYHYRMTASNSFGVVYGDDLVFHVGLPPEAITLGAVDATKAGATLTGLVNPEGAETSAYFEWGSFALSLNNRTVATNLSGGGGAANLSAALTGLSATASYYYQIVASNSLGVTHGATLFFSAGPWSQTTAPIHNWDSIASSASGSTLVAVGYDNGGGGPIYTSTNYGVTWISNNAPLGRWQGVACSADGSEMVVAGGGGGSQLGPIYLSTNFGASWAPANAPSNNWYSVASSADGTILFATEGIGQRIYRSADSGATWAPTLAPSNYWASIASSADGTNLVAVSGNPNLSDPPGPIYTSTNSGTSWISNNVAKEYWIHVSSSADGEILLAVAGGNSASGPIYTSTNSGSTWQFRSSAGSRDWIFSAMSADGSKMAAVAVNGSIYTSTNFGTTWTQNTAPGSDWNAIASSADGSFMAASVGYPGTGGIYTFNSTPAPVLGLQSSGGNATISWVIPSADFGLQQSSDLSSWIDVTNPPVFNLSNLQNQVAVPASASLQFYRLKNR